MKWQKDKQCRSCDAYVEKPPIGADVADSYTEIGRCRRNAPVAGKGFPEVFPTDGCCEHKTDENKI
jgi:hypothetical protein